MSVAHPYPASRTSTTVAAALLLLVRVPLTVERPVLRVDPALTNINPTVVALDEVAAVVAPWPPKPGPAALVPVAEAAARLVAPVPLTVMLLLA